MIFIHGGIYKFCGRLDFNPPRAANILVFLLFRVNDHRRCDFATHIKKAGYSPAVLYSYLS